MCECYKIGGRFIAEDPNCPAHGTLAQKEQARLEAEREQVEEEHTDHENRITALEELVWEQAKLISTLITRIKLVEGKRS